MGISKWLDQKEREGFDVSHVSVPEGMLQEESPAQTIYFKEIRPCSILCTGDHPFATVERFGNWFYCRGRDKEKGPHTTKPQWWMWTRDVELALKTAREHLKDE
ncbi:MAG TPA: hypothetical protein PK842_09085 [Smithella sp.]|jgi:hypothetical protein|nr:hypothetical protein [Deltaproteobacteria bacterium]HOO36277.1 hypothetical protein [Smithella sp.]HOX98939.1 hypothetical protein [Smithella sp.]HPK22926.1 hypothetical protein [Smithella sp.]HQC19517.1 hypothetical protein [Smithella sp.]